MKNSNFQSLPNNLLAPEDDKACNHLRDLEIPDISLPTQNGNFISLKRKESFRLVLYFYPMTESSVKKLPKNWNNIPGARGCIIENCSFRDNYEELIKLNSFPIGITTQNIEEIKEMKQRLFIDYDILSDYNLKLSTSLKLPTFNLNNQIYIKRLTLIVYNNKIQKFFYPIFPPDKHIFEVLKWLKEN